jgi:hyperosmotically inducible periplasmic protein
VEIRSEIRVKEFRMKDFFVSAAVVAAMFASAAIAQPLPEAPPPAAPKGTVAASVEDSTISSRVKDAIGSDSELKDVEVTVDTTDGIVTLNGTAASREQIGRALALARTVDGVKGVTNLLAIRTS